MEENVYLQPSIYPSQSLPLTVPTLSVSNCLSLHLSLSFSLHLFISFSPHLSVFQSVCLSSCLLFSLTQSLSPSPPPFFYRSRLEPSSRSWKSNPSSSTLPVCQVTSFPVLTVRSAMFTDVLAPSIIHESVTGARCARSQSDSSICPGQLSLLFFFASVSFLSFFSFLFFSFTFVLLFSSALFGVETFFFPLLFCQLF